MNTPVWEGAMFLLPKLAKQSNPNKEIKKFFFHSFKDDKNLCSVYSLSLCVDKQGKLHVQGHQSKGIWSISGCPTVEPFWNISCHTEAVLNLVILPTSTTGVAETLSVDHQHGKSKLCQCFWRLFWMNGFLPTKRSLLADMVMNVILSFSGYWNYKGRRTHEWKSGYERRQTKIHTGRYSKWNPDGNGIVIGSRLCPFNSNLCSHGQWNYWEDTFNKEQVVLCCSWEDGNLEGLCWFIFMKQNPQRPQCILHTLRDFITQLDLSITRIMGQCYDGASPMAGTKQGVEAQILQERVRAIFTCCYEQSLKLGCSDAVKTVPADMSVRAPIAYLAREIADFNLS